MSTLAIYATINMGLGVMHNQEYMPLERTVMKNKQAQKLPPQARLTRNRNKRPTE